MCQFARREGPGTDTDANTEIRQDEISGDLVQLGSARTWNRIQVQMR